MVPTYHASKTVSSSVVTLATELAAAIVLHRNTNRAEVQVIDYPVRYTLDGSTPSATVGIQAPGGTIISLRGPMIAAFKCIRESSDAETEIAFLAE